MATFFYVMDYLLLYLNIFVFLFVTKVLMGFIEAFAEKTVKVTGSTLGWCSMLFIAGIANFWCAIDGVFNVIAYYS